ncbi:hypothetical protein BLNAU_16925 [Blattamonas nauphoetae]|uniref:Uncharacterized protein n=1 Tax=Blattamonas nauphoetae TaxID=2049346 RepID=A0ABQ9X9Y2_9EUKA|nr:hypothetical protein BLNAU_16925 [Blattamonas nauphoetae]
MHPSLNYLNRTTEKQLLPNFCRTEFQTITSPIEQHIHFFWHLPLHFSLDTETRFPTQFKHHSRHQIFVFTSLSTPLKPFTELSNPSCTQHPSQRIRSTTNSTHRSGNSRHSTSACPSFKITNIVAPY